MHFLINLYIVHKKQQKTKQNKNNNKKQIAYRLLISW